MATELHAGGVSCTELKAIGYTLEGLKADAFPIRDLRLGGFSAKEMRGVGYTAYELSWGGYKPRLIDAVGKSCPGENPKPYYALSRHAAPGLRRQRRLPVTRSATIV